MNEWVKYTGSPEQIDEMWNAEHGYILRFKHKISDEIRFAQSNYETPEAFKEHCLDSNVAAEYLICNPHQNADMIRQQALTGQPVYCRMLIEGYGLCTSISDKPNWHTPGVQYSFIPFED